MICSEMGQNSLISPGNSFKTPLLIKKEVFGPNLVFLLFKTMFFANLNTNQSSVEHFLILLFIK